MSGVYFDEVCNGFCLARPSNQQEGSLLLYCEVDVLKKE